jgi:outer membrane protein
LAPAQAWAETLESALVQAYLNNPSAVLELQRRNVEVLQEQLRQTRDRFNVGEVTRTDVAQSESRLAQGRSQVLTAEATYKASAATYRQVIGVNPSNLTPGSTVDRYSPHNLPAAVGLAIATHPAVTTAEYNLDAALRAVKVAEAALYPTVSMTGNFTKNYEVVGSLNTIESYNASVLGTLSVPIYQGGAEYSLVRQAKETLGQRRLDLDVARDQVRQTTVQSWGQLEAAKSTVDSTQAQVQAAEIALNGVREEARVGQRTTLDVLNAQQELVNARGAGRRPARPGGGVLHLAGGGRAAGAGGAGPARAGLSAAGPLPAGARQLGRPAQPRRPLKSDKAIWLFGIGVMPVRRTEWQGGP